MNRFQSMFKAMPPVTKNLILINLILLLAMWISPQINANLTKYCALHFYEAKDFNLIQPVTYMFLHGGFLHLLFNMFTLFMFGPMLEYNMGSRRFLTFYMVCGVGAGLVQEVVWALTLPDMAINILADYNHVGVSDINRALVAHPGLLADQLNIFTTVGASGAIYGILLAFAMLYPNRPLYMMFIPVPIKAKYMMIIWGGVELLLGLSEASDGVAHFAHIGGMIFGFMLIAYWKKKGVVRGDQY